MKPRHSREGSRRLAVAAATILTLAATTTMPGAVATSDQSGPPRHGPTLLGRAVLPASTIAGLPVSGEFMPPGTVNGITFPLAGQPVIGFSAIVEGSRPGEYLAMPDNGFGNQANSRDFLIRAYALRPFFKTAHGGSGTVRVGDHVSFRDPGHRIGFPIVNEAERHRLLTGTDIDPESLQRGRRHDLWVGDEFGPWILHFDTRGRLLDPPFAMPHGITSPSNQLPGSQPATHPNSRGLEAMAITPDGRYLYAALEGATPTDTDQSRRLVFEFDTAREAFTGHELHYRTEQPGHFVADMWAVDRHRFVVIERDGGRGETALFRKLYLVDLRHTDPAGFLVKTELVDLAAIPDPDLVSLPPLNDKDVGLGDPYRVTCESVEAVHVVSRDVVLVGCDNNLPNTGRNPLLADDSEFILVRVPGLRGGGGRH